MAFGFGGRKKESATIWELTGKRIAPGQGFRDQFGWNRPVGFFQVTQVESGQNPVQPQLTRRFRFKIPPFTNI